MAGLSARALPRLHETQTSTSDTSKITPSAADLIFL